MATDVGGVAEGVGSAGLLTPPRDPSAFAAACVRLLTDEVLRKSLSRKARDRAVQLFSAERCFALYRGLYDELGPRQGEVISLPEEQEVLSFPEEQEVFRLRSAVPVRDGGTEVLAEEPEVLA